VYGQGGDRVADTFLLVRAPEAMPQPPRQPLQAAPWRESGSQTHVGVSSHDPGVPSCSYYDVNGSEYPIPSAPWTAGDKPRAHCIHFDIVVSGWKYNGPRWDRVKRDYSRYMDATIEFNNHGPQGFDIRDPQKDKRRNLVHGQRVSNMHDGHCQGMRWELAHADPTTMRKAMTRAYEICHESAVKAASRPKM